MNIGVDIREAIRRKKLTMDDAAKKLDISRTTLHTKLLGADNDPEFVQLVKERLGISLNKTDPDSLAVENTDRKIGEVDMKFYTVPLKDGRAIQMWIPKKFSKEDAKTLKSWLVFYESTL